MKTLGIVAGFVLVVLLGLLYWASHRGMPWRATAMLMIERAEASPAAVEDVPAAPGDFQAFFDNEIAALRRVGAAMLAEGEDLKVTPIPKTHLAEVTVRARDPETAARRCNAIVEAYKEDCESRRGPGRVQVISPAAPPRTRYR